MPTVTFNKTEAETRLFAIFLAECVAKGLYVSVSDGTEYWIVTVEGV